MVSGNSDMEQRRSRLGLLFLVAGVLLVLWAWGSWIYRTSTRAASGIVAVDVADDAPVDAAKVIRAAPMVLLGVALVVLAFLVASYVFVRASRRYRQSLERRPNPPTDSTDLWSMHKLKDFDDSDAGLGP